MRICLRAGIIGLGVLVAAGASAPWLRAQSPQADALRFEVASIKRNPADISASAPMSVRPEGDRLTLRNIPLRQMVQMAYQVNADDLSGPGWMATERFDVTAKASAPLSATNPWQPMLKALLVERFHVSAHTEMHAADVFSLVRARPDGALGPQLHPSQDDCYAALRANTSPDVNSDRCGVNTLFDAGITGHVKLHGVPLAVLLSVIAVELNRPPPADVTGLAGTFDFELVWTPQSYSTAANVVDRRPEPDRGAPAIATALQEQLGLKLEAQKGSKTTVVIDHIEQPTEN